MRRSLLFLLSGLFCVTLAFCEAPSSAPVSAFDEQLIDQEKQLLQAEASDKTAEVDHAVAEDFQGIETNGDFYDRGDLIEPDEAAPRDMRAYDFRVVKLNDNAAVVAYNLILPREHPRYRHMADAWAKIDGRWQLKFRQVTLNIWSANDTD